MYISRLRFQRWQDVVKKLVIDCLSIQWESDHAFFPDPIVLLFDLIEAFLSRPLLVAISGIVYAEVASNFTLMVL